jgi:reticulon-4-interacting protein 1, mitochondrial
VIDYRAHDNVYAVLKENFSGNQFDVVIDAMGIQTLFESSSGFLKPDGLYVTVGVLYTELSYTGMLGSLFTMAKNFLWPVMLGGVPRKYIQVASAVSQDDMARLANMCQEGRLEVPIDDIWEFEDVLKVSRCHESLMGLG